MDPGQAAALVAGTSRPAPAVFAALAFMTVLMGWLSFRLRSFWRYEPPPGVPAAVARVRGYRPAAVVTGWCFVGSGWLFVLDSYHQSFGLGALASVAAPLTALGIVITVSIMLTGRPRRLVPPNLRD